ncbi:hypothetical protein ACLQ3C_16780 [Gordonia sp. DT30]|uniref:MmyB family transcriptional regulator n=1 Tax=Gordonia sp. DT30 TaxID=3416546 RepID=UPI003CF2D2EE
MRWPATFDPVAWRSPRLRGCSVSKTSHRPPHPTSNRTVEAQLSYVRTIWAVLCVLVLDDRGQPPKDPRLPRLIAELRTASAQFVSLWETEPDAPILEPFRHKVIEHPDVGPIAVDCDTLVTTRAGPRPPLRRAHC